MIFTSALFAADFDFNKLHLPDFKADDGLSHKDKLRKNAYIGFDLHEKNGRIDFSRHSKEEYIQRMERET